MKVLIVTNMYPSPSRPFYGVFVKEQVDSLRSQGINIDVEFLNGKESRLNYFRGIPALVKKLKENKYDIIHAHHTYCVYPVEIARTISRKTIPLVVTFHEGEVHRTGEFRVKGVAFFKRLVLSRSLKRLALRGADHIISVQEELMMSLGLREKFTVVPCGVDLDLFKPMDKDSCRKRLNLPKETRLIFFPASPGDKNKGYDLLSGACDLLGRKDVRLLTGGNIRHEEMPLYMSASDAVVQLSSFEASPMVLKEAMAVNVPVLFSEVGDAKLTVGNAHGCFLCKKTKEDVAKTLREALQNDGKSTGRERIIQLGLGLPAVASRIIGVYEGVLKRHSESVHNS